MKKQGQVIVLITIVTLFSACGSLTIGSLSHLVDDTAKDTTTTNIVSDSSPSGKKAKLLSAFFGLDSSLPIFLNYFSLKDFSGKDGMPVVFSHELDFKTIQAGDFEITTKSGKVYKPDIVTLAPAEDIGELRTVLLVGEYGSIKDQPVKVEIVGNILSIKQDLNFKGKSVGVVSLEDGPSIALAQVIPKNQWRIDKKPTLGPGGGSGCPVNTKQVIRVTWQGGITKPGGKEVDDKERVLYKLVILNNKGKKEEITPFALGDLKDGDNNHLLCLDTKESVKSVYFPAGYVTDPREDLNKETTINISN